MDGESAFFPTDVGVSLATSKVVTVIIQIQVLSSILNLLS